MHPEPGPLRGHPAGEHLRGQLAGSVCAQQPVVVETAQSAASQTLAGTSGHQALDLPGQRLRSGHELFDRLFWVFAP